MELRQLEHFIAVAEERSFTRAALRLNMAQSAISASVRTLERDLGTELLHRTTQNVRLSAAGETLLPQARKILADVADASDLVADVQAGVRGTLTIGTMQALVAGPVQIAPLLAAFREEHPLLEIRLRQATRGSAELAEEMLEGRIDVAVLALQDRPAGIQLTPLATEPLVLVCCAQHRLASRSAIRLSDVAQEPFVDHPIGWGTRAAIDAAFAAAGVERQVIFEISDTQSVLSLVRHGLGVALLPPSIVQPSDGLTLIELKGRAPVWEISLATPANRPLTAAARAFAAAARGTQ